MQCFKKRLSYLVDGLIPAYQKQKYPQYVAFIKGFIEYLDIHVFDKIFRITDNININLVFDELVDEYFQQYFYEVIDTNKYALNDENKRLFVELSKFFNNQKGKRTSFDLVLNYLENFDVSNAEAKAKYNIDQIEYKIQEDYHNFDTVQKKYNRQYSYNGKDFYKEVTEYFKPFTYRIETDQPKALIWSLIEDINPVGFYPEFDYRQDFTEEWPTISEEFVATIKFDFVDQLYTNRLYNGKYFYGQSSVDTMYLYDGTNLFNAILKYIPKMTVLGSSVITYSPENIIDEFSTKIKPAFEDDCPHNLLYGGIDDYNAEQTYDGGRDLIDIFEVFANIKSYIEDVLSLSDNFSTVKIGIDYIDTFANIFYNGRFHYRRNFTLTYGVNNYSLKYNGILSHNGTEHYASIDQYTTESMHQNYRKFDIYPLYQFINETILGHDIYLNISGASTLEILNECIALIAAHLGVSEDEIAPIVPSLGYDFSIFETELDTLSQTDSRDATHYNFNVASIIENITNHFSLPNLESSIESVWVNMDVVKYDAECKYDGGSADLYYAADNITDRISLRTKFHFEEKYPDIVTNEALSLSYNQFQYSGEKKYSGTYQVDREICQTTIRESAIIDSIDVVDDTSIAVLNSSTFVDHIQDVSLHDGSTTYGLEYTNGLTYNPQFIYDSYYDNKLSYDGVNTYSVDDTNVAKYNAEHCYSGRTSNVYYLSNDSYDDISLKTNINTSLVDESNIFDSIEDVEIAIKPVGIVDTVVISDDTTSLVHHTVGIADTVRGTYSSGITYSPNYVYSAFYNGLSTYSGDLIYSSEIDFEKYYSDYDKLDIYEFIINNVLGVLPDAWVTSPTTDIETLERCVYGLSVHTGISELEIAPLGVTDDSKTDVTRNIVVILAEHFGYTTNKILLCVWGTNVDVSSRKYDGYFNYYPIEDYHEEYAITVYRNGIPTSEFDL